MAALLTNNIKTYINFYTVCENIQYFLNETAGYKNVASCIIS